MRTIPAFALLLPLALQGRPAAQQEGGFRVVSVDQTGKPPYTPEGRVYRITGGDLSRLKPGDILTVQRPKEERTIGTLRVISVQQASATARLEIRGELFPLIGDVAMPLAALGMPGVSVAPARPLKSDFKYPMQPVVLPLIAGQATIDSKAILPPEITKPFGEIVAIAQKIEENAQQGAQAGEQQDGAAAGEVPIEKTPEKPPEKPAEKPAEKPVGQEARQIEGQPAPQKDAHKIEQDGLKVGADAVQAESPKDVQRGDEVAAPAYSRPAIEAKAPTEHAAPSAAEALYAADAAAANAAARQRAFYFMPGSAALSPIGLENLRQWTREWGTRGATYYLKVPASQLNLERLLLDRLEGLEKELLRLGVPSVEYRNMEEGGAAAVSSKAAEPFDPIYVGAESYRPAGALRDPSPSVRPLTDAAAGVPEPAAAASQRAVYFMPGSSAITPIGLENLRRWTREWGTKGPTYFLKVPQSQLRLDRVLLDRLRGLEIELSRLGVASVEYRAMEGDNGEARSAEPDEYIESFEPIYVGAETNKGMGAFPGPASIPLAAQAPMYALDEPQPEIIEQFPIYFLPDSSSLSPRGAERLHLWVQGWGTKGTKYFLSVPQDQIKLEKILIERLAALQRELAKLGITDVDIRPDEDGKAEPYETIYLGVEVWK